MAPRGYIYIYPPAIAIASSEITRLRSTGAKVIARRPGDEAMKLRAAEFLPLVTLLLSWEPGSWICLGKWFTLQEGKGAEKKSIP